MIKEISDFMRFVDVGFQTSDLRLSDGVYILMDLKDNLLAEESYESYYVKKGDCYQMLDGVEMPYRASYNTALHDYYSKCIDANKSIAATKTIVSINPYTLKFNSEKMDKVEGQIDAYYDGLKEFYPEQITEAEINGIESIRDFLNNKFWNKLRNDPNYKALGNKNSGGNKTDNVKISFYVKVPLNLVKAFSMSYLKIKAFNKDDYNVTQNDDVFGLSNFLNGNNVKKPFMEHVTAPFVINNLISFKDAYNLYFFEKLLGNRKLPNPFPIFIVKDELNKEMIGFLSEDTKLSYREIIRKLNTERSDDFGNYYLVNYSTGADGVLINDIDYVDKFNLHKNEFRIVNFLNCLGDKFLEEETIDDIFAFEIRVIGSIFSNTLVSRYKDGNIVLRYFGDVKCDSVYFNSIMKYRGRIYDYIYKSRRGAIDAGMLEDIVITHIRVEIKKEKADWGIKEKLNILFSIYDKFNNQKQFNYSGGKKMGSLLPNYIEKMRKILHQNDYHISNDGEFAFAAGQLIYYVLRQSRAGDKTHSLLEPFINKNEPELFKKAIVKGIENYKHSLGFDNRRVNKLAAEVLGYECTTMMRDIMPILLAGYFADNLIFEKLDKEEGAN